MEINKSKGVIEAILFAAGREVKITELMSALEESSEEIITLVESMKEDYKSENRGLQIVNVGEAYQLCTKQEYYEYLYTIFDKRNKPNLSQAAIETLAIIAYNGPLTRLEIDQMRGVSSSYTLRKLLAKDLIYVSGKSDLVGKPNLYSVSKYFLDFFGLGSLSDLPKIESTLHPDNGDDLYYSMYKEDNND